MHAGFTRCLQDLSSLAVLDILEIHIIHSQNLGPFLKSCSECIRVKNQLGDANALLGGPSYSDVKSQLSPGGFFSVTIWGRNRGNSLQSAWQTLSRGGIHAGNPLGSHWKESGCLSLARLREQASATSGLAHCQFYRQVFFLSFLKAIYLFIFGHSLWDLNSLTRDQTCRSIES